MTGACAAFTLWLALAGPPESPEAILFRQAEGEFREGVRSRDDADDARPHFRSAADGFDALTRRGVRNPALYRDLGNARLLADDLPRALLAYRTGLRLYPADRVLREALSAARERVVFPEGSRLGRPPPDEPLGGGSLTLAAATLLVYAAGWACLTRWLVALRGRMLVAGLACVAASAVAGAWVVTLPDPERDARPVVVIAGEGVLLRRGNGASYPAHYETPLPRGAEGRLRFARGGWLQVELAGGEVGWVPEGAVVKEQSGG